MTNATGSRGGSSENRFADVLASSSKVLRAEFDAAKSLRHRGLRGTARELALVRNFLEQRFPKQFGFATGEVVTATGSVSNQQDIIIYHASRSPVLFRSENIQVVPAEGVLGVVEVKSRLDKRALREAVDQIRSAKSMSKTAYYPQHLTVGHATDGRSSPGRDSTLGYVFAYGSIKLPELNAYLEEWKADTDIDGVFVLDHGSLVHTSSDGVIHEGAAKGTHLREDPSKMPLLRFYLQLWSHLIRAWTLPIKLSEYFGNFIPVPPPQVDTIGQPLALAGSTPGRSGQ